MKHRDIEHPDPPSNRLSLVSNRSRHNMNYILSLVKIVLSLFSTVHLIAGCTCCAARIDGVTRE